MGCGADHKIHGMGKRNQSSSSNLALGKHEHAHTKLDHVRVQFKALPLPSKTLALKYVFASLCLTSPPTNAFLQCMRCEYVYFIPPRTLTHSFSLSVLPSILTHP